MNLRHLCTAPNVQVYFDSWNNWLYLEWEGALTLADTQHACLAIARCFVAHAYPRVLTSNAGLTHVGWDVGPWLARHFLPYLELAGVRQLAWVYGPDVRAQAMAEHVLRHLGPPATVALFADLEDAVQWLQQQRPPYQSGCELLPRLAQRDARLTRLLGSFEQELAATQALPAGALALP